MPKYNVQGVSKIVRQYFDEIKKSKFIFDVVSVQHDEDENVWKVYCEVSNVFEEEPRFYVVTVDDDSGDINDVQETD
jgi:hypothetical protein